MSSEIKPLIVIVGETASGKSALGMRIAKEFNGEIIAADSRTVYKGMDIGTAKPNKEDQEAIPHHCLDLVKPNQTYSAAQFKTDALKAVDEISKRGNLAVMVGGTGLYINSVIYNYDFGIQNNNKLRSELNNKSLEELQEIAIENWGDITPDMLKNRRHLQRLIERGGPSNKNNTLRENTIIIGLKLNKNVLREHINTRIEQMFRAGLKHEVRDLFAEYGEDVEAFSGIVYDLFRRFNRGEISSVSQIKRKLASQDLKLAKRQRTWFKRDQNIQWFDNPQKAYQYIADLLSASYTKA